LIILATTAAAPIPAHAIPAFARKYGLPCSACHEGWPKLNNFGTVFRDNGYQLGNDRDAAIYQAPSYWPSTFRITPQWHRETTNRAGVDTVAGDPESGTSEARLKMSGFDLSGLDFITAGTLAKNISFMVLPAWESSGEFGFESAWVRFDNLLGSHWLNLKLGKHELDLPFSEHRSYALSGNGGYQTYHFAPTNPLLPFDGGQLNSFPGIGENQLGLELAGHSKNSYTRYAFSVVSNNGGTTNLPSSGGYDYYANFSQAFELKRLGVQRVGAYAYYGQAPTYFLTSGGEPIPGAGRGDKSFYRAGAYGQWYVGKFDLATLYMHGRDSAFLGTGTPANQPALLPPGARNPTWNGGFAELHYTHNPQLVAFGRYELIRMSQQAFPVGTELANGQPLTHNFGNVDAYVVGYRWYPIMMSRGGLAWHQEYSWVRNIGVAPITGLNVSSNSFMMGLDLAF
jgi:hypothetical protein